MGIDRISWACSGVRAATAVHFFAFHPDWKMRAHPTTPRATPLRAREIALSNGVRYAYVGNMHDKAANSTYC